MPTINRKTNIIKNVKWSKSNSAPFYNSMGWHTLRNAYISTHPLCERCLMNGISRQAEEVHHKRPFLSGQTEDERWQLLLNPNNLMSLCTECHDDLHRHNSDSQ